MTREQAARLEVRRLPASLRRVLTIGLGATMLVVLLLAGQFWVISRSTQRAILSSGAAGVTEGVDLIEMWEGSGSPTPVRVGGSAKHQAASPPVPQAQGPSVVRNIRLTITVADFDPARRRVEALVEDAGGTVASIGTYAEPKEPRVLTAALHIPSARVESTLAAIRDLGHVSVEEQEATDVARQVVDLDARLLNLRTSEARLRVLLESRTGTLADVLAAERELTRVRGELEAMDATRRLLARQTSFADVRLEMRQERTAALDVGTRSVRRRLRNAATDGGSLAAQAAIGTVLLAVRFGPSLLFFVVVGVLTLRLVRQIRAAGTFRRRPTLQD